MSTYVIGKLIKTLRVEKGYTQEQLCEGICTKVNLSRIENGKNEASRIIFEALLERLGEDPNNYLTGIISKKEHEIYRMRKEIDELIYMKNYEDAFKLIVDIEKIEDFTKGLNLQFISCVRLSLQIYNISKNGCFDNDLNEMEINVLNAIKITKKNFSIDQIKNYILTDNEIRLINIYAITSRHKSDIEKAVKILHSLKENIEILYTLQGERIKIYLMVLYNLVNYLENTKKYEEIIELCNKGIELSQKNREYAWYPYLLFSKAFCMKALEDEVESKTLIIESYYGFRMVRDYKSASAARKFLEENFSIIL